MSLSKDFSDLELANLALWKLPSIKDPHNSDKEPDVPDSDSVPARPTTEDIEAMQKVAFDEASKLGRQAGYEKGLEEGRKEGFEQGRQQGIEQGREKIERRIREFEKLMDLLDEPLNELDEQVEEELVALSVAIAKQLVRRELQTANDRIVAVIREAIQALPSYSRNIRISMHPEDAELVRSVLRVDEAEPKWEILEDPLLTRGGCLVETQTSRIDATLENRLNQVIAAVLGGERGQDFA